MELLQTDLAVAAALEVQVVQAPQVPAAMAELVTHPQ
jgi:hypothetical protein